MKLNKYNRTARVYPSIIVLLPFLVFTMYCDISSLQNVFDNLLKVKIVGNITISAVLLYLLVQTNRFIGKYLFERTLFNNEMKMPTTNYLMHSNSELSNEYKTNLRKHILSDFQIELASEQEEVSNPNDARKRIIEAVGLIRQKVKDGRLLIQHNIEYGFARNLIGGSIIGVIISLFDIIYFAIKGNNIILSISIALMVFFVILLLIHKPIIKHLGNQYAKRLFQEYLQK